MFAAIKDVVDTTNASKMIVAFTGIKNIVDVITKMVSITKPTEDIELDGVTLDDWVYVTYPDIRSS
jgi:hypothetical protein